MTMKLQREPGKVKKAARKAAPRKKGSKPSTSDMFHLDDTSELEVTLDSLGSFFNHLIDTDYQQEDTGASNPVIEEVTILSSDPEPLPRLKVQE